jgi:hypothetical protein
MNLSNATNISTFASLNPAFSQLNSVLGPVGFTLSIIIKLISSIKIASDELNGKKVKEDAYACLVLSEEMDRIEEQLNIARKKFSGSAGQHFFKNLHENDTSKLVKDSDDLVDGSAHSLKASLNR